MWLMSLPAMLMYLRSVTPLTTLNNGRRKIITARPTLQTISSQPHRPLNIPSSQTISSRINRNNINHHRLRQRTIRLLSNQQKNNNSNDEPSSSSQNLPSQWTKITSPKNPTVKHFQSLLAKKKYRKEQNQTVIEGHRLVIDLLSNPSTSRLIRNIVLDEQQALRHPQYGPRLRKLLVESRDNDITVSIGSPAVVKACTDTVTPQGVLATISLPPPYTTTATANAPRGGANAKLYLLLDGLSDPGNCGTLFRSAAAVGVEAVILFPGCVDVYGPKAVRSGMGATFHVPVKSVGSVEEGIAFLRRECSVGKIFAASMEEEGGGGRSVPYWDVDWSGSEGGGCSCFGLCIGREGSGLSEEVRGMMKSGDVGSVFVPMEENSVESLNAAVCGSVVMFEYYRQMMRGR